MPNLNQKPTLNDFQRYVRELEEERGFTEQNVLQECLMLGEEVGELFKAIRKSEKIKVDHNSKFGSIEEELADVLIYICSIANRCNVDLEKAFREKEEVNKKEFGVSKASDPVLKLLNSVTLKIKPIAPPVDATPAPEKKKSKK